MKKTFLLIFVFSLSFFTSYSYTNISSCGTIVSSGEYIMNDSILNHGATDCIVIQASHLTFDCNWNTIDGSDSTYSAPYEYGISDSSYYDNITIKNCIITEFPVGIHFRGNDNIFENIIINNSGLAILTLAIDDGIFRNISVYNSLIGFYLSSSGDTSIFEDIFLDNVQVGIQMINENYHNFSNIYINATSTALIVDDSSYSNFDNITLYSDDITIEFQAPGFLDTNTNNSVTNSYLGNFSKITFTGKPTEFFSNNTFSGNTYLSGTLPSPPCFFSTTFCEGGPIINSTSQSSSAFPSVGISSSLFLFLLLSLFFIR